MDQLNNRPWKGLVVTLVSLLIAFVAVKLVAEIKSVKYIGSSLAVTNSITVSGKGEVIATPDIATFSFTVSEEAPAVPDAQKKATDKMNNILAFLKKSSVEDKDVKTTSYNIYPRYEYQGGSVYNSGKQVLAAYVVSQSIEVKVRKLDDAGKLLSGIGEFGADNVSGLSFSIDKQDEVARQARDKAITDARSQAEVLAKSLGVTLGRIVSFNESTPGNPYPIYYSKDVRMMAAGMGGAEVAPSLPSGENKIISNVTVTYEIK